MLLEFWTPDYKCAGYYILAYNLCSFVNTALHSFCLITVTIVVYFPCVHLLFMHSYSCEFQKFLSWYKEQGKVQKLRDDYSKKVMRFARYVTLAHPDATEFETIYMNKMQYRKFNKELTEQHGADIQTVLNYCKALKHFIKFF